MSLKRGSRLPNGTFKIPVEIEYANDDDNFDDDNFETCALIDVAHNA